MAVNRAFEPNNDEMDDRERPDSPNVQLDTYFADEKVQIPDRVSDLTISFRITLKFFQHFKNRQDSAFVSYGRLLGLVF